MKRIIAILLAVCTLASALTLNAFASELPEEEQEQPEEVVTEPEEIQTEELTEEIGEETTEEPVPVTVFHTITIADEMMEKGYVIPNRRTAKEGDAVVLTAYEKEYTEDGKKMKMQFVNFETESDVTLGINLLWYDEFHELASIIHQVWDDGTKPSAV